MSVPKGGVSESKGETLGKSVQTHPDLKLLSVWNQERVLEDRSQFGSSTNL